MNYPFGSKKFKKRYLILLLCSSVITNYALAAQQPLNAVPKSTASNAITVVRDGINTELAKQQAMNTELYAADLLKADKSCFADSSAFNACFGLDWPTGGTFDQAGNYTLTGSWDFSRATVTGVSDAVMSSYPTASSLVDGDKALISKSTESNSTQQAAMSTIKDYVLSGGDELAATFPLSVTSAGGYTTYALSGTGLDALESPRFNAGGTAWEYVKLRAISDEREPVCWFVTASDTATAVADGKQAFVVPASMNGMVLVDVTCSVYDLNSAASGATTVVLRRVRGNTAADMTSTGVTISYNEYTASDETIDASYNDLETGDKIYVDVNEVTSPAQKGLSCTAIFANP